MAANEVRLSVSSDDTFHGRPLIIHQAIPNRRRKSFLLLESIRRCALISGSVLVIVGILLTLFGYVDVNFEPFQLPVIIRRPLRVAGPICLSATLVLWTLGYVFTRIWKFDRKSRLSSITLRDRVKLHALAIDVLKKPSLSPGVLHDPHLRRQFLQQLRQHSTAVDLSFLRSSDAIDIFESSTNRYKSNSIKIIPSSSSTDAMDLSDPSRSTIISSFQLPGIQISRFESVNTDDRSADSPIGSDKSFRECIRIESDGCRISCTSEYSLLSCGSQSRPWDPVSSSRESDWDADVSIGSRESQASRNEWVIGPISTTVFSQRIRGCHGGMGHGSFLSPIAHRKSPTIVSFDIGHSNLRRHSSPGLEARWIIKSCTESKSGQNLVLQSAMKKYGCRDLRCCSSQTSNRYLQCRNDVTMVCQRLQRQQQQQQQHQQQQNKRLDDKQRTTGSVELLPVPLPTKQQRKLRHNSRNGSGDSRVENPTIYIEGVGLSADEAESLPRKIAGTHKILGRTKSATDPSYTGKLPVCSSSFVSDDYRRDKTGDDSEMEDRLGRLIYEIDYSVTESVDESKIRSQDFEPMSYAVDAETQTHAADTVD